MSNLYKRIYKDGKEYYEHRLKVEKKLGRKLRPDEHVHHKDENKDNNNGHNLAPMNRGEHTRVGKNAKKYDGCKISGCKKNHHSQGYCKSHYRKFCLKKVQDHYIKK